MSFDLDELTKAIEKHGTVARIVIVDVQGSTPREIGASMLVWDGGQCGTIGGGALEFDACKKAFSGPQVATVPLGPALGQCCGGSVTLVTEVFDVPPAPRNVFRRPINGLQDRFDTAARHRGVHALNDNGNLRLENGWLSENINPSKTPIWIYGAGHVGRALVHSLSPISNFEITWVDIEARRYPDIVPDNVVKLVATKPGLTVRRAPSNTIYLVLTHSHALDLELCHQILRQDFDFAGLIGSATKWARFKSRLKGLGHTDAQISRITCPIGDPNLGKQPQAIAIGVAARLLSRQNAMEDVKGSEI